MKTQHLAALAVAGSLAAGGATLVHGGATSPAGIAAAAPAAARITTTQLAARTPATGKGHSVRVAPRVGGRGLDPGETMMGRHGIGRGLTVTAVNGSTISATAWGSRPVTVSATTVYTQAGGAATLADVTPGAQIAVRGTRDSAGTITATGVTIVLPRVMGVVTAVNGTTLTVSDVWGTPHTVTVGDSTRYERAGQSASLSAITVGSAIVAEGKTDTAGALTALRVTIRLPRAGGQVATVNGSSFTLSRSFGGGATTVTTSSATTIVSPRGTSLTTAAIKAGSLVMAEGTLSSDGSTLAALRVVVMPAMTGRSGQDDGPGLPGGFGRHGRGFPGDSAGTGSSSLAPASPSTGGSI